MDILDAIIKAANIVAKFINPISRFGAFLTVATSIYTAASGLLDTLVTSIDSLVVSASGALDFRPLAFANHVFPLTETIGLLVGYIALYIAAATIRIIKSWIPTVN